jgi:uncharacterized protein (DUF1499 family)
MSRAILILALAVALVAILAGFGSRWDWWTFRTGFSLLRWAIYGAIALLPLAALALFFAARRHARAGVLRAGAALLVALVLVGVGLQWRARRAEAPPIHDITTDTENPPAFVAIAPLRVDAPNPVEYAGEATAEQQRAAYPDIRPVRLDVAPAEAFERALAAVDRMGWRLVAAEPAEGRIEATDRTFWFGFYDDVVIRVRPADAASIIDIRSKSRVGRGDIGTNARRVRALTRLLND